VRRESFRLRGGLALSFLRWGADRAPDLLLLHGGNLSADDWQEVAPALAAAGWRVTALDLRGCGESDWDPEARYGVEQAVADIEELGFDSFVLVGHSLGAVAACVYAARHPEAVRACVMEDGGPADHTKPSALLDHPQVVFGSEEEAYAALPPGLPDWVPATRFRSLGDGRVTWRSDLAGRVRWAEGGGEPLIPGLWPYVEALRCPTLVVRGADSTLFRLEVAERMTALNPMIQLVTIAQAGHLVHCQQPAAFTAAVLDFLSPL
jgi:pimeloyl-ACP methyl ester carboxylesterase